MPESVYIHPTAVVDPGAELGPGCKVWHFCHLSAGAVLGADCNLGQNVFIADGVRLGRGVKVQNNVSLYTGVEVEDEVFIGPSAVFTNVRNPRAFIPRRNQYAPTLLKRGCTLGANVTIVCGVTIGEYAFIGAGAVVTREVPPFALILGTPGRVAGWVSRAGHRLHFDEAGQATCPETGERYQLDNDRCIPV